MNEDVGIEVNDAQSKLNGTWVNQVVRPESVKEIQDCLQQALQGGYSVSVAGGRHAMGGQQFGAGTIHFDMSGFNQINCIDLEKGIADVQSGIQWPELIAAIEEQCRDARSWAIRQKPTGVDKVTIAGCLSANIHGRGLSFPPFVDDVESFSLLDAASKIWECSREENPELFSLVVGGYGLFGIILNVKLRLVPRTKVKRHVEVIKVIDLIDLVTKRKEAGYLYGDCQYAIDLDGPAEEHQGVFSCYQPVGDDEPVPAGQKSLSKDSWKGLYELARANKKAAFEVYSKYYMGTNGQIYWSDSHQLSSVFEGYMDAVKEHDGTEMITEVYVRKEDLNTFLATVRTDFIANNADVTYGTIRFIEKDQDSFLAWASESWVCIVCNLHVVHSEVGIEKVKKDFGNLLDRVIEFGGCFYLTYHKWISKKQVEAAYPQFREFLMLKQKYDPSEVFQSDWYRYFKDMYSDVVAKITN